MSEQAPQPEFNALAHAQMRANGEAGQRNLVSNPEVYQAFMEGVEVLGADNPEGLTVAELRQGHEDFANYLESRPKSAKQAEKREQNTDHYADTLDQTDYSKMPLTKLVREWASSEDDNDVTRAGDIQDAIQEKVMARKRETEEEKMGVLESLISVKDKLRAQTAEKQAQSDGAIAELFNTNSAEGAGARELARTDIQTRLAKALEDQNDDDFLSAQADLNTINGIDEDIEANFRTQVAEIAAQAQAAEQAGDIQAYHAAMARLAEVADAYEAQTGRPVNADLIAQTDENITAGAAGDAEAEVPHEATAEVPVVDNRGRVRRAFGRARDGLRRGRTNATTVIMNGGQRVETDETDNNRRRNLIGVAVAGVAVAGAVLLYKYGLPFGGGSKHEVVNNIPKAPNAEATKAFNKAMENPDTRAKFGNMFNWVRNYRTEHQGHAPKLSDFEKAYKAYEKSGAVKSNAIANAFRGKLKV